MISPTIRLRAGKGWSNPSWEKVLPELARTLDRTSRGLSALGVDFNKPKIGSAQRVETYEELGEEHGYASEAGRFIFKVLDRQNRLQRSKDFMYLSGVILHEIVHCVRFEHFDDFNFVERTATEGLAYWGEYFHTVDVLGKEGMARFCEFDLVPDRRLERDFRQTLERSQDIVETDEWFSKTVCIDMPAGAMFGAQRVQQQISQGISFAELLTSTPEKVLNI